KQTLQTAVSALNLNIQKLTKTITLTQTQITQKDREIQALAGNISDTSGKIGTSESEVADSLRQLDAVDAQPMIVTLLSGATLYSVFDDAATLASLRTELEGHISDLSSLKTNLETNKTTAEQKRQELANLNTDLNNQKQGLAVARDAQNKLLADTKNKEST